MENHATPAQRSRHGNEWHVTQCACGHLTLQLGPVRVEFTTEEFALLHQLVGQAMTEFDIVPSEAMVLHRHPTRH